MLTQKQKKWDHRFMRILEEMSTWSKDPSTQVACLIVDKNNRIVSSGYNGFAKGVDDTPERYTDRAVKYELVLHSEINAIIFAQRDLANCTIYTYPMPPCSRCTGAIIQSGITRVVAMKASDDQKKRWQRDFELSAMQREEAGIEYREYNVVLLDEEIEKEFT